MARRKKPTGSPGYIPPKERREIVKKAADKQLDRYIKDNYESTKDQDAGIKSIVTDMPSKFAKGFAFDEDNNLVNPTPGEKSRYFRKDGSLNEAGKYILGVYSDERPEYSRGLNRFVNSSPQLKAAYARRAPFPNFAMNIMPRFIPVVGPAFTADQVAKNKRLEQNYLNRPESDYNKFVEYFKPQMNSEQIANTEVIESEREPLVSPDDMNIQKAVNPSFASPQDMGFLDDQNIFDSEKAAIDAALTPGNVFDPVAADKQSKVDFINQVENTNLTVDRVEQMAARNGMTLNDVFERSKQKQGGIIRDEVNRDLNEAEDVDDEDPIPGGQFNLTSPTVNEDTVPVILGGAGPDYEYGDFMVNEDLGNVIPTDNMFPEGGVSGKFVDNGNVQRSFVDDNYGKENPDIFVNDKKFDSSGLGFGFANGGSTNKYENMSTHEKLMRMAETMYG